MQIGPLGLPIVFHHREHPSGAARGGGDVKLVGGEARHHAVVVDEAVITQQYAVLAPTDGEFAPVVHVHAVHELGGVRPDDGDLAERRGIEDTDAFAYRQTLARDRGMHVLATTREIAGALPHADVLENGALARGPRMHGRASDRVEEFAPGLPGEAREGDRGVRHAERRQAHCRHRLAEFVRRMVQGVEVRRLALIGRHAGRGVAFDVLDRAKAFAHRQIEIFEHDIVLKVDEGFRARCGGCGARHDDARRERMLVADREARGFARSVGERCRKSEDAAGGADRAFALRRFAGHECLQRFVVAQLAARLREQMHRGRVASRHQQQIAVDARLRDDVAAAVDTGDVHRTQMIEAPRALNSAVSPGLDTGRLQLRKGGGVLDGSQINEMLDLGPRGLQFERRGVGAVAYRRDDDAAPGQHGVTLQVLQGCAGEHDSRAIVARKHERLFDRTGRENDFCRAHLPEALAGTRCGRILQMVGQAFAESDEVVREIAECRGTGQQADSRIAGEFFECRCRPCCGFEAIDAGAALPEQRPTEFGSLVAKNDPPACLGGGECCGETRGAAADDENLTVCKLLRVAVRVGGLRCFAESGHAANQRFVESMPCDARPHEGLVVEPCGKQRRKQLGDPPKIVPQGRPAVLAVGTQAFVQLDLRGAQIGRGACRVTSYRDECARFLGPCGHDAAWAMIFERPASEMHAVGEQCRGQGVTVIALITLTIKSKAQRPITVDASAALQAPAVHGVAPDGARSPAL